MQGSFRGERAKGCCKSMIALGTRMISTIKSTRRKRRNKSTSKELGQQVVSMTTKMIISDGENALRGRVASD